MHGNSVSSRLGACDFKVPWKQNFILCYPNLSICLYPLDLLKINVSLFI